MHQLFISSLLLPALCPNSILIVHMMNYKPILMFAALAVLRPLFSCVLAVYNVAKRSYLNCF